MSEREPEQGRTTEGEQPEEEGRKDDAQISDLDSPEEDADEVKGGGTRIGTPGYGGGYGGY